MPRALFNRDARVLLSHTTAVLLLLTLIYYAVPSRASETDSVLRLVVSAAALGALLATIRVQMRRSQKVLSPTQLDAQWLLSALYLLILVFALAYFYIAQLMPGQFVGVEDRTDALYFSVTLVSTVGFGDIHPAGTVAQLVVTAHMVINLLYLGTALRLLSSRYSLPS